MPHNHSSKTLKKPKMLLGKDRMTIAGKLSKVGFIAAFSLLGLAVTQANAATTPAAPALTAAEMEAGKLIYFERCAGCHGVLRKGATGKNLEPHWSRL